MWYISSPLIKKKSSLTLRDCLTQPQEDFTMETFNFRWRQFLKRFSLLMPKHI